MLAEKPLKMITKVNSFAIFWCGIQIAFSIIAAYDRSLLAIPYPTITVIWALGLIFLQLLSLTTHLRAFMMMYIEKSRAELEELDK